MATAIEQLVIDTQSRFLEMKSLQPYSTKDEYLYAMKEDLADWLSTMYPDWRPITAENFLECLENGALLCYHANNVNNAARQFSSNSLLTDCKYRLDARPQTFNARDNVSQFIKWSRHIAGVREVLMFESDDLILRKNEKNFILCLLEIARFGSKFGMSVPAIIKLEQEIEQEIERDKLSSIESIYLQSQVEENLIENDTHWLNEQILEYPNNSKQDYNNTESNEIITTPEMSNKVITATEISDEMITTTTDMSNEINTEDIISDEISTKVVMSNDELEFNRIYKQEKEKEKPIIPPASSSHLHKTVIKIVNSCCCSQRFPVIRIGEGKYRIGENGTIIFIRILRNHVMVRVGGGWDTLENYLNKHDPCRRSGHHHNRNDNNHNHHHHSDIPILAIPNTNVSSSVQKNTPFGKSITIKTEEFPLPKPSNHDTNLVDAQLVITRGADGRHRIGQITYKTEEDILNQPPTCPHHHHQQQQSQNQNQSPPTVKTKAIRNSGRSTPSSIFTKQSSPSTDQDYSSLTETTTTTTTHSKSSSLDLKEDFIEQAMKSLNLTEIENRSIQHYSPIKKSHTQPIVSIQPTSQPPPPPPQPSFNINKSNITESVIGNIDGYNQPTSANIEQDFDINDIADAMKEITKKSENTNDMDNDSLESSEGVLEEKPKGNTSRKSSGYVSAFYLAEKQKFQQEQAANRKRAILTTNLNRNSSRSTTLPNAIDKIKKDKENRRKPMYVTQRSKSTEIIDKTTDISKLDRDSGFDEQDFRRERLNSNGDDNSSVSSIKSTRSSINIEYRENKSYELRMKKLDTKRTSVTKDSSLNTPKISNLSSRRASELIPPIPPSTTNKYRKNSRQILNPKLETQNEKK